MTCPIFAIMLSKLKIKFHYNMFLYDLEIKLLTLVHAFQLSKESLFSAITICFQMHKTS